MTPITQEEKNAAMQWLRRLAASGGPHAKLAETVLQELHDLNAKKEAGEEFMSETIGTQIDPSIGVWWMRCSPGLDEYVRDLELAARIPAELVATLRTWSGAEPSQSALAREVDRWLTGEGFVKGTVEQTEPPPHAPLAKRPRLFYFEEAENAWCPADGLAVDNIISADNFSHDGEEQEIRFKRSDLTDVEMATLPEA